MNIKNKQTTFNKRFIILVIILIVLSWSYANTELFTSATHRFIKVTDDENEVKFTDKELMDYENLINSEILIELKNKKRNKKLAEAYYALARVKFIEGDNLESIEYLNEGLKYTKNIYTLETLKFKIYSLLCNNYISLNNIEEGNKYFDLAKETAIDNDSTGLLCDLYYSRALSGINARYDIKDSLFYAEKSLKYSTHLDHKIRNLLYISTLYKLEENFDESFRYIDMALELALQSDDKDLINSCMINLGENYYIQKNYAKTIMVYEKILKSVHNKSNRNLVDVYGYLAECYGKKGFYTEYTYYRDEYIKLSKEMNSIKDLEWIYAVSAEIEIENGNINLAREYFNKAKYLFDDKTIMYLNSDLYLDFIKAKIDYYSSNDYKVAMQNYINILNTLTERGYKSDLKNLVISEMLKISYKSKDYSKFMEYLVNYKKIESIQNAQNATDALLIEYNAKIKEKELYASNVKVGILVLIIMIIIYLLINTKRKNIKINELNTKLRELNKIDPLTNIYNRGHLDHILVNSYTESRNIVLVMIDIDYFKQYNDNYGHVEGDKIIVQLGKLLKDVFYDDFVFRYGGEEFSILSYRSKEEIISTIKLLFTELYNKNIKHEYSSISDRLTVSIGVASAKVESKENVSQLLKDADHKLYESKENGRNTYTI